MTDYGRGGVLGAATVLPATTAATFFFAEKAHPYIIYGLIAVSAISFVYLTAQISRYLLNRKK